MTKIILICADATIDNARQKIFYNLAYGYSSLGVKVGQKKQSFEVHIVTEAKDLDKIELDKDSHLFMHLTNAKVISAEHVRVLVAITDQLAKIEGANNSVELING